MRHVFHLRTLALPHNPAQPSGEASRECHSHQAGYPIWRREAPPHRPAALLFPVTRGAFSSTPPG